MASFEITGTIYRIGDTQQVTEKFAKRTLILLVQDGQFAEYPAFEFQGERCKLLDGYTEGEEVKVHFQCSGRMYEKKDGSGEGNFSTNKAWRIEKATATPPPATPAKQVQAPAVKPREVAPIQAGTEDDLPF